ncbi:phosphate signaling complex protein PhoU [Rhodobacterales bacterium HKCCA1288]|jgi:phosphate transport system protein|uniref:phosphate signaling complex protein PhoU n=1 Tax=Roseovarius sp. 10 TaxID=3080563 RepID=UPI0019381C67|nr:phosphate signaling complex protein PhoU [Roseovarius sp. 10]MDV7200015.1 phosphate signaling complex protein PhoU [Roseovarius sp. 10]QPI85912.1 phosphate signaling complex protein PhoU [Rhodobacterales bacterium HKCCA1288]
MNTNEHIVSSFDRDLESIQAGIMKMGGLVEDSIHKSVLALDTRDPELADLVRAGDAAIDALETQVNEEAARILALRSPTASDLRTVLSVFRVSTNLERIGDYSKNIAKRSHAVMAQPPIEGATASLRRMAREVELMLKDVLDAYIQRDLGLAEDVRERDLEIDQIYSALFREYLTFMMEDPRSITACMHLHFMAKNIERMGDHVTSIAEQVVYLVTGAMPEDIRPKQDVISESSNKS